MNREQQPEQPERTPAETPETKTDKKKNGKIVRGSLRDYTGKGSGPSLK